MSTSTPTGRALGWTLSALSDPDLLLAWLILAGVLLVGGLAIYAATRWYRNLNQPPSTSGEDLGQLPRALEQELSPEEMERLRAAIERRQDNAERGAGSAEPKPPEPPA
jgi:hypothetical protein